VSSRRPSWLTSEAAAEPESVLKEFINAWDNIGIGLPGWLTGALLLALSLVVIIKTLSPLIKYAAAPIVWLYRRRTADRSRRCRESRRFAKHIYIDLERAELNEEWRDESYAELEAEVEVETGSRSLRILRRWRARTTSIQRVSSLSKALRESPDQLILLEGEPGAGKSVALRHVALQLANLAHSKGDDKSLVPIYVNLKEFRPHSRPVTANSIREFILYSLTRTGGRDVEAYLDANFDERIDEGRWLFLLDSFDEIPDVLGASDEGDTVGEYATAIAEFLGPINGCRGVVASREFRAPKAAGFSRFRIVPLTEKRRRLLIRRADLPRITRNALLDGLADAGQELNSFSKNPMFLGLLCEHMRAGFRFPTSSHAVFKGYLDLRLKRDANRIRNRFKITPEFLLAGTEEIAFAMASSDSLGLSPSIQDLRQAVVELNRIGPAQIENLLDALDYIKLGRLGNDRPGRTKVDFTFSHRRFQEYFATRVVVKNPGLIPVEMLLVDARWRETVVTILQTRDSESILPLTEALEKLLTAELMHAEIQSESGTFSWSNRCLHVMGVLKAGLSRRPDRIPHKVTTLVDLILSIAWRHGQRVNRHRAVKFVAIGTASRATQLLEDAFSSRSHFLQEGALRSASELQKLSPISQRGIRRTLINQVTIGSYSERMKTWAQVRRFSKSLGLASMLRLLFAVTFTDAVLGSLAVSWLGYRHLGLASGGSVVLLVPIAASLILAIETSFWQNFGWGVYPRPRILAFLSNSEAWTTSSGPASSLLRFALHCY